jgi:hypothetical protein
MSAWLPSRNQLSWVERILSSHCPSLCSMGWDLGGPRPCCDNNRLLVELYVWVWRLVLLSFTFSFLGSWRVRATPIPQLPEISEAHQTFQRILRYVSDSVSLIFLPHRWLGICSWKLWRQIVCLMVYACTRISVRTSPYLSPTRGSIRRVAAFYENRRHWEFCSVLQHSSLRIVLEWSFIWLFPFSHVRLDIRFRQQSDQNLSVASFFLS